MANIDRLIAELFERDQIELRDDPPIIHEPIREDEQAVQLDHKALLSRERLAVAENALGEIANTVLGRLGAGPDGIPPRIRSAVQNSGLFDFCAWYQPIHFFGYDWGIFVREDCI